MAATRTVGEAFRSRLVLFGAIDQVLNCLELVLECERRGAAQPQIVVSEVVARGPEVEAQFGAQQSVALGDRLEASQEVGRCLGVA